MLVALRLRPSGRPYHAFGSGVRRSQCRNIRKRNLADSSVVARFAACKRIDCSDFANLSDTECWFSYLTAGHHPSKYRVDLNLCFRHLRERAIQPNKRLSERISKCGSKLLDSGDLYTRLRRSREWKSRN